MTTEAPMEIHLTLHSHNSEHLDPRETTGTDNLFPQQNTNTDKALKGVDLDAAGTCHGNGSPPQSDSELSVQGWILFNWDRTAKRIFAFLRGHLIIL